MMVNIVQTQCCESHLKDTIDCLTLVLDFLLDGLFFPYRSTDIHLITYV